MSVRLLTAREVSDVVGVAPATVLRWTRNGDIPAVRLPSGAIRYVPEAFEEWLAARATSLGGVATRPDRNDVALTASHVPSGSRHDRPRLAAVRPREEA